MIELLKKCIDEGKVKEALIVGRNLANRFPNDREGIITHINFLLDMADCLPSVDDQKDFLSQADFIINFVEENADLSIEYLQELEDMKQKVETFHLSILNNENEKMDKLIAEIEKNNSNSIVKIHALCDSLKSIDNKEEFDVCMKEIASIDNEIEKDYLSDELKEQYDLLTKECTELISKKMEEIEHKDNIIYNVDAVNSYEKAFNTFKGAEQIYKKDVNALCDLLESSLFKYDVRKLFNETLNYYNHIYAYIFEKLDEKGKLALTQFAITCERKVM